MRERIAEGVVLAALRHAQSDAIRVILFLRRALRVLAAERPVGAQRRQLAQSERRKARIGKAQRRRAGAFGRALAAGAPDGCDGVVGRGILDGDVGAQLVHLEAFGELRRLGARRLQAKAVGALHHEELEQDFSLRAEQAGVQRALLRDKVHIVGDHALQQLRCVGTLDADNAAIGQQR